MTRGGTIGINAIVLIGDTPAIGKTAMVWATITMFGGRMREELMSGV